MQKQLLNLPVGKWGTLKSKYFPESKDVSPDEFTAGSYNFITNTTGAIEKRPTDVQYNTTALVNNGKDQFEAIFANGVHNLLFLDGGVLKYTTGDGLVHTAQTGYTPTASMEYSMYQNRVYFDNGVDNPSVYDLTASYGGITYSPPIVKTMGAQPPVFAPTFSADSPGGSVPLGGHFYKITFLYYGAEESNGGPSSVLHTVSGTNQTVNLTGIPVGGYGVTTRNIYRDNNDGNFLLVGTISDNTTVTFADSISAGTTPIPTSNNAPPIFSYIALNLSRLFVAGVLGTPTYLFWSNPGQPNIFDPNHFILCNPKDPITALAVYQGNLYVFNRHSFGVITGLTDDTFAYQEFPGTVGCVDNRSIQVRTINGVPLLVWLSDRGFYHCNGSTAEYISDPIEDLVNLNIQQATFVTGSNTQSTQADFAAGTSSPSIDLASNPGVITTINPEQIYQAEADWEGGSSLTNIATADGSNSLKVPVAFSPTLGSGTLGGSAIISGSTVTLPRNNSQTIPAVSSDGNFVDIGGPGLTAPIGVGQKFTFQHNGTLTGLDVYVGSNGGSATVNYRIRIYSDALDQPGTVLYETTGSYTQSLPAGSVSSIFISPSLAITAGSAYWFTIEEASTTTNWWLPTNATASFTAQLPEAKRLINGNWVTFAQAEVLHTNAGRIISGPNLGSFPVQLPCTFFFSQTPVAESGTWISATYDSESIGSAIASTINVASATYETGSSATLFIDASNDPNLSVGVSTQSFSSPSSGNHTMTLTNLRYWRLRWSLTTSDNRNIPTVGILVLAFSTTGTWISQPIDCTTDVTAYNALSITQNVPLGTSVAVTVATSADNITYTSYGPVGSATVQRYVKVKVVLTATTPDTNTPSVSFLEFSWNLTATFISSIINVGQVPSGWGVFQDQSALNGGTLVFYMRSAASSGGISGATFQVVSNGNFPPATILPLQYVQWKAVFMSIPAMLPTVDSVTLNWFLGNGQSPLRVASLFFNKTYYLAAAELNQTTNNIVIVYDFEGKWRLFRGVTINSLGLFYNQPFYFDAVRKNIYQWLIAPTGSGAAITMDIRSKAFDLGDINKLKIVRSLRLTGINTGTTFHAYYSTDRGVTWIEMLNVVGVTGYTTSTSGNKFSQYFVPNFNLGQVTSGNTIMYRVTSTDAFPATLMNMEPVVYVRSGKYLEVET